MKTKKVILLVNINKVIIRMEIHLYIIQTDKKDKEMLARFQKEMKGKLKLKINTEFKLNFFLDEFKF